MTQIGLWAKIKEDIQTALKSDPAASSAFIVAVSYPGVHALWYHRFAQWFWRRKRVTLARLISQLARRRTGIEIHPGAILGRRIFIDHGMGVVIGETAVVGDDVLIFHGVTLGGTSFTQHKRHPTVADGVILGAGAKILGPITIGAGARVGANAVVVRDVPAGATAVGVPAQIKKATNPQPQLSAPGRGANEVPWQERDEASPPREPAMYYI